MDETAQGFHAHQGPTPWKRKTKKRRHWSQEILPRLRIASSPNLSKKVQRAPFLFLFFQVHSILVHTSCELRFDGGHGRLPS